MSLFPILYLFSYLCPHIKLNNGANINKVSDTTNKIGTNFIFLIRNKIANGRT